MPKLGSLLFKDSGSLLYSCLKAFLYIFFILVKDVSTFLSYLTASIKLDIISSAKATSLAPCSSYFFNISKYLEFYTVIFPFSISFIIALAIAKVELSSPVLFSMSSTNL